MNKKDKETIITYNELENIAITIMLWCGLSFILGMLVGWLINA